MRKQLRLSGSGGQGVITAAIILAEAAVAEGKEAAQSQSYGPEARGGASKAEVIIDTETIYHPHVINPDLVLAMTQKAADKYYEDIVPGGLLVLDEQLVPNPPDGRGSGQSALCQYRGSGRPGAADGYCLLRHHQGVRGPQSAQAHRGAEYARPAGGLGGCRQAGLKDEIVPFA